MLDVLIDSLLDTLKVLPFLLIAFIILEFIEHKLSNKNKKVLTNNKKYGPILGGLLGAIPQCGFSSMASNLFSKRVISVGTLIAIFLSTSDEMLPIMIGENVDVKFIIRIILIKVVIGILCGLLVDLILNRTNRIDTGEIHDMCDHDHCDCKSNGILVSSIIHTLSIALFILIANIIIGYAIYFIGEDNLSSFIKSGNILTYFISSLVGLIPNCASSVIITELYLSNLITLGTLLSGLLTGSGLGILILFKTNSSLKENLTILTFIYIVGVVCGIICDLIM